eukprot:364708-Chlamydomonas_euryale.AAC.5
MASCMCEGRYSTHIIVVECMVAAEPGVLRMLEYVLVVRLVLVLAPAALRMLALALAVPHMPAVALAVPRMPVVAPSRQAAQRSRSVLVPPVQAVQHRPEAGPPVLFALDELH